MLKILLIFLVSFPFLSNAQGLQQRITVPYSSTGKDSALLYLPPNYSTSQKYPILIFAQGAGEAADGTSAGNGLAKIYNQTTAGGPANLIATGQWPSSFINPKDGKSYSFIVVSIQQNSWSITGDMLDVAIPYLVKTYSVDTSRIYLMGISAGGEGVTDYISQMDNNESVFNHVRRYPVAGAFILSAAIGTPTSSWATPVIANGTHVLGAGDPSEIHGDVTQQYVTVINKAAANQALFMPNAYGHGGWNNVYTPKFLVPGTSINCYQWLLQFQTKSSTPPVQPPPVVVPSIKAVLLQDSTVLNPPHSVVVLTDSTRYADTTNPGGSYLQVSGPTKAIFTPGTGRQMYVSNLQPGSYRFELLAMNGDTGKYTLDSAFVNVTVKPMPVCPVCPPPIVCPPQRTATSVGVLIGGNLFILPMTAVKIGYSDGSSGP